MVRIGPLSDEQRQALEQVRRRAVGRVSQRAHMVLLSARGYTVEQIAEIFGMGEDVVRTWLHRYEQDGPLRLDDRPRPGRPPSDTPRKTTPSFCSSRAFAQVVRPMGIDVMLP